MKSFLARWRPGHVIAAWVAYWIGLAGVTLTPPILAIIRAASGPKDSGNVAASFNNDMLSLTVTEFGKVTLAASASLLHIALWVGVPPLALYAVWMVTRPRRPVAAPAAFCEPGFDGLPRPDVPQQAPSSSIHSRAPMRDTERRRGGTVLALILPLALLALGAAASARPAPRAVSVRRAAPGDTAWRPKVRAFAEAHLQHTAWGPAHGRRDYETTLRLAKAEGLTVDDDALYAAAYLHDMGGIPPYALPGVDHGDRSIQLVDSILRDAGFPMEKSALVKEIIDHHQYYRPPDTLRVAVLFRDADILDFMGAIDVARILSLTTREKFTPDLAHAVAAIKQQMVDMPKLLQSDAAKVEGQKRVLEMQQYLNALAGESDSLTVL